MTTPNPSLANEFHTAVDIPVDNPPRDPGLVVKRRRACEAVIRCQTRYRVLAVRLKRIAKTRGITPEQMLDTLERKVARANKKRERADG